MFPDPGRHAGFAPLAVAFRVRIRGQFIAIVFTSAIATAEYALFLIRDCGSAIAARIANSDHNKKFDERKPSSFFSFM